LKTEGSSLSWSGAAFRAPHIFRLGWEIILELTRRLGAIEGAGEQTDWAGWYHSRFGKEPNYSELLDALASSPGERRSILHKFIEPTAEDLEQGRKVPTRAHRAIAKLIRDGHIRVVITTNFDRLLENALRDEGVEPTVIKSEDDIKGAVPLIHTRCLILKVHGDYLDTRIRNTEKELTAYTKALNAILDRIMDEHGLIVCGWSADWDKALRAAIIRAPNRRYPFFWAARGDPSAIAKDLIKSRNGRVIPIKDADNFFESLQAKVEIQAALQRANPASMELLVAATKKYLSRSEYRIQLHDLIMDEVRRLQEHMTETCLGTQGNWSTEEFRHRVARYDAIAEPLIRVFAEIGRWGDGTELPLAMDILRVLGAKRILGGLNHWINLRTYPAMLLLYAFGIGAVTGARYKALFQWLTAPVDQENRSEAIPAVQCLFSLAWNPDGTQRQTWQNLEGFSRRKTPLSDHLHDLFQALLGDYALNKEDFELLFERFEIMASLAHTTSSSSKESLARQLAVNDPSSFEYVPYGRSGWHEQTRDAILAECRRPNVRRQLLEGGFANGDEQFLELSLKHLSRAMSHMRWL
jgi:SIR2-like domain